MRASADALPTWQVNGVASFSVEAWIRASRPGSGRRGLDQGVKAPPTTGYWRVGRDLPTGWGANDNYLDSRIGDVSIYPVSLTAVQVAKH